MATSSSSPSASALSSQSRNHDVFLSFRGEDTRKTFVDHLYSALVLQGIDTYKDDEILPRGESIGPTLMKAIEESQIAVIVFSVNYADSSWCLDELAHIMKCKDTTGQIVLPIFYDVDPSTVRKQKDKYGEALSKHALQNMNKVESWKKALFDASNLSGWEPKNIANGHESKAIKEIVDNISSRLQLVTSNANEDLIGIAARVHGLKSELQIGSGGVRMIGIWGVGGGGKTTLASSIYDEICQKFDGCCFIANIREESRRRGLEELKKEILSQTGGDSVRRGRCLIDKKLRNRKVLIVLDDVDQHDQLEALAGSPNWFGAGSRIIITTRNENLLNAHKVVVHNISLLSSDEAIELFRKHAPQDSIPMEDYDHLSKEVVCYAGGLPLALKVLGSSLCDKSIYEWRSALARLKVIPENEILEKLKISFDGLTKVQKDLFLDIACFFRRVDKDVTMERLDACGFHPVIGVEELRQKALITISDGKFDMHDLVQEMGHYIVRGKHPKNPEKHSRVWKREDLLKLCAMDAMTELDKIEAIQADFYSSTIKADLFPPEVVEEFKIRAYEDPLPPILANMRNLRYIQWKGDPAHQLLNKFPPRELCCLILRASIQDQLWSGYKVLPNLKIMELYDLKNLILTPNFDGIPYLERFKLSECLKVEEIHSSFRRLERLICLTIEGSSGIKMFPSITRLKKLETLSFRRSRGLFELSEIQQKMDNLGDEDVISSAVWELSNLNNIRLCFSLKYLRKLDLRWCNLRDENIGGAVWELPNLQELDLSRNKFSRLDFSLILTPRLRLLDVALCTNLVELLKLPSSIAVLRADYCSSLKTFGDISNCKWLWKVSLREVVKLGQDVGSILLDSMLKGNAIEDQLISIVVPYEIPKGFVGRLLRGTTFRLPLPHNWYNDYCGFLIHVVTCEIIPEIDIIIKREVDKDSQSEHRQEFNEEPEPEKYPPITYVGYVSFTSLRRTACLSSTYNVISISLSESPIIAGSANKIRALDRIGAALVPRKIIKEDPTQGTKVTIDYSQFWDEKVSYRQTFTIEHDLNSSIKILWKP